MYSDLLVLAGSTTPVAVWSKGGVGITSVAMGATVQTASDTSKLVLSNGSNTWTWDASDVGGFAT